MLIESGYNPRGQPKGLREARAGFPFFSLFWDPSPRKALYGSRPRPSCPHTSSAAGRVVAAHIMRRRPLLLTTSLLLLGLPRPADGFAAWLVEGVKCWTDLLEGEVIMNAPVIPSADSPRPGVRLAAVPREPGGGEGDGTVVLMDGPTAEFDLRLIVPPEDSADLADLQYVADLSPGSPARFVGASAGCDGRRTHGRGDGTAEPTVVRVDLDGPPVDPDENVEADGEVVMWAGWATGHEPVVLTDRLVIRRRGGAAAKDGATGEVDEATSVGTEVTDKEGNKDSGEGGLGTVVDTVVAVEDAGRGAAAIREDMEEARRGNNLTGGQLEAENRRKKDIARQRLREMRLEGPLVHDGGHDAERVVRDQIGNSRKRAHAADALSSGEGDEGEVPVQGALKYRSSPAAALPEYGTHFRYRYHEHGYGMRGFSVKGYLAGCALMASLGWFLDRAGGKRQRFRTSSRML